MTNQQFVNRARPLRSTGLPPDTGSSLSGRALCISWNDTRRAIGDHQAQLLAAGMRGGKTVSNRTTRIRRDNQRGAVNNLRSAENESAQRGESPRAPRTNAVCAWCGAELPNVDGLADGEVTHGICAECFEREVAKIEGNNDGRAR